MTTARRTSYLLLALAGVWATTACTSKPDIPKATGPSELGLSLQVLAQAPGPVASGLLRDASGTYTSSLILFGSLAALAALIALVARHPRPATA